MIAHQQTFLLNAGAEGRHRTWCQPAYIRVVPATGHKGEGIGVSLHEAGCDRGDVWQMSATVEWIVADHGVSGRQRRPLPLADLTEKILNRITHRTQVHGNMRSVGDKRPLCIEQRTGEIHPLPHIHGTTGLTQPLSHALSNLHETVMEEAEINRIRVRVLVGTHSTGIRPGRGPFSGRPR